MNKTRIPFYEDQIAEFQIIIKQLKKRHATISVLRLIVFVFMCFSFSWLFVVNRPLGIGSGIALLILFLYLLKYHRKIEHQRDHYAALLDINNNELQCCNGNYQMFDGGNDLIDPQHPYSYDIDLFGQGSVFQYINRTILLNGRKRLTDWLVNTPLHNDTINKHQKSIVGLAPKVKFRQHFQSIGYTQTTTDEKQDYINEWLGQTSFFSHRKTTKLLLWILPILAISIFILTSFALIDFSWLVLITIVNLSVIGFKIKEFNKRNQQLTKAHTELKKMGELILLIERESFDDELSLSLKGQLFENNMGATKQIHELTRLLNALDNRNNILIAFTLNSFLLWDWQCLWRIEKWQQTHQLQFGKWMNALAYFDALNSLANMAYNNPDYHFPVIINNGFIFEAEELGHPLIEQTTRVCNNFNVGSDCKFAIVTGANMAGKSTFLRTVAVNLILAQTGAPVCAGNLRFSPRPLFTSMRTEDSLIRHESYFFAELKRLQTITTELEHNNEIFIILDEILRGTNSEDKRKGSMGFISKISQKKCFGLVATHDLELARLAASEPNVFKALCFEVLIDNDQLKFNYKLQPGVTQNMNASFLMKQMKIMD